MIKVERRSYIEHTTPAEVFELLSDPKSLGNLLPRVQKVEMLVRDDQKRSAKLATHMSLGGIFGTIRCEGDLSWNEPREIIFKVRWPLPVDTVWTLEPAVNGTQLIASMNLDLTPMLGPMAQFVPTDAVADMIAKELEAALRAIEVRCAKRGLRERAVAA